MRSDWKETNIRRRVPEDAEYVELRKRLSERENKPVVWLDSIPKDYEESLVHLQEVERENVQTQNAIEDLQLKVYTLMVKRFIFRKAEQIQILEKEIETLNEKKSRGNSQDSLFRNSVKYYGDILRNSFLDLLGQLISQENSIGSIQFVKTEIMSMYDTPDLRKELEKYLQLDEGFFTLISLQEKILDGSISSELLCKMAKRHQEIIQERVEKAERIVEETKQDFLSVVQAAVDAGWLPVSMETVRERIEHVKGKFFDKLNTPFTGNVAIHDTIGFVLLYSDQFMEGKEDDLRNTIFHEFIHEISGKLIQTSTRELELQTANKDVLRRENIVDLKLGVSLQSADKAPRRFVWLNEAITEWLSLRLSGYSGKSDDEIKYGYKGSIAYIAERKMLDQLFEEGLDEKVVLEAYFENIDETQPPQQRARKLKALFDQIHAIKKDKTELGRIENNFQFRALLSGIYETGATFYVDQTVEEVMKGSMPGKPFYNVALFFGLSTDGGKIEKNCIFIPDKRNDIEKFEEHLRNQKERFQGKFNYQISEGTVVK